MFQHITVNQYISKSVLLHGLDSFKSFVVMPYIEYSILKGEQSNETDHIGHNFYNSNYRRNIFNQPSSSVCMVKPVIRRVYGKTCEKWVRLSNRKLD